MEMELADFHVTVRPDLLEILPLFKVFGNYMRYYLVFGKKSNLLWQFFMQLGKLSLC